MTDDKEMTNLEDNDKNLTNKNILFLHHIKTGKSTLEAYELAGYAGNAHAAYELRSYLRPEIEKILNGEGIGTKEGMLLKLKKLQELPLNQSTISVKEATELLKFEARLQPKEAKESKPQITPVIINFSSNSVPTVTIDEKTRSIDIEPIDIKEP